MANIGTTREADPAALAADMELQHVADIVETLNRTPLPVASRILAHLPLEQAAEILDEPQLRASAELVKSLPAPKAVALLQALSADRAAAILRVLEASARLHWLDQLDPAAKALLEQLLAYPPDTAGSLMTSAFVSVPATFTVEETLQHIRAVEPTRETVYATYVLDPDTEKLLRVASLRELIAGEPQAPILSVAPARSPIVADPMMDREDVACLIAKYNLIAIPVVDEAGHVLGIMTVDDVIDAMIAEGTEDVQKLGGMQAMPQPYLDIGFAEMIRKRGGWLIALFLGEMLTASAMQYYEADLARAVVLTLFIPLIMSSGGNSGSQATSLIIRALAVQALRLPDWWRVALRELPTGLILGALLGLIGMGRIALWQVAGFYDYGEHWPLVALTVGAALVGIVTFGSLVGSLLPFLMQAIRLDPATSSAPFVATLVDVMGIVIYFSIAIFILRGTLL
ncbi:magnesium transporter [Microvirga yunnanensis]|uniref:magnesium transporter n=1 Tax=Microvirga yunnanensis TaxID=2953740 RepID=UPI00359F54CE